MLYRFSAPPDSVIVCRLWFGFVPSMMNCFAVSAACAGFVFAS